MDALALRPGLAWWDMGCPAPARGSGSNPPVLAELAVVRLSTAALPGRASSTGALPALVQTIGYDYVFHITAP